MVYDLKDLLYPLSMKILFFIFCTMVPFSVFWSKFKNFFIHIPSFKMIPTWALMVDFKIFIFHSLFQFQFFYFYLPALLELDATG